MKLIPNYSYEFNCILNDGYTETEQIKNFASLLSDKDRFLPFLDLLEKNAEFIEERMGSKLPEEKEFFVVRAEKFKSFSEPITIEYSLLPEEMILFLLKELVKISLNIRFPDEQIREQYINSFVEYIAINGDFGNIDFVKFGKNLHDESKKNYPDYEFRDIDFSKKTLKQYVEEMFDENA
ncbi:MAG: hypothetical protein ACOCXG_04305 [Nanoarchaeota archaeon]